MRYLIVLQYDGTDWRGFQRQPHCAQTIQECVETALQQLLNLSITIFASGRTDVGVHAIAQTAHFDCDKDIATDKIVSGCNHFLPSTIRVLSAKVVEQDFHARYCVVSKTYQYLMYTGAECPLLSNRAYRLSKQLDLQSVKTAVQQLLGTQDFFCYMSSGSSIKSTVRTVYSADLQSKTNPYNDGQIYSFVIKADGFLYNMVRKIVAHLIRIGFGKADIQSVQTAIECKNKSITRFIAPACGLYLKEVEY